MKCITFVIIIIPIVIYKVYSIQPDISEFKIYNLQGDTIPSSEFKSGLKSFNDILISIYLALPTCHQCCADLDNSLSKINKTFKKVKIIALIYSKPNIIDKRLSLIYFRKFFGNNLAYYFIHDSSDSSRNSFIKINDFYIWRTPAIVLYNKKKHLYLSYEKLFKGGFFEYLKLKEIINDLIFGN